MRSNSRIYILKVSSLPLKFFSVKGEKRKLGLQMLAISVFMFNKMILGLLVVISFKKIIKVYLLMC